MFPLNSKHHIYDQDFDIAPPPNIQEASSPQVEELVEQLSADVWTSYPIDNCLILLDGYIDKLAGSTRHQWNVSWLDRIAE